MINTCYPVEPVVSNIDLVTELEPEQEQEQEVFRSTQASIETV